MAEVNPLLKHHHGRRRPFRPEFRGPLAPVPQKEFGVRVKTRGKTWGQRKSE